VFCLITALGATETVGSSAISAGENDLRLVGGVMKRLHERPILSLQGESAGDIAQLQIVLNALTLDDINHIWCTQAGTPYRLSVGYELALVPLPLALAADRSPRVGSIGVDVRSDTRYQPFPAEGSTAQPLTSQVPAVFVDSNRPDWAAHLVGFATDGSLQYSLLFSEDETPESLPIIALGEPGTEVTLEWEILNLAEPDAMWRSLAAAPASLALAADTLNPLQTVPEPSSLARDVVFPLRTRGQAMLYAFRDFVRPDGSIVRVRSNPLLVSVHGAAAS
jgi:hypothetical protein